MSDSWKDMRRHGREPRRQQFKSAGRCGSTGKRMFRSEQEAMDGAAIRRADLHCNATYFRAYRCPFGEHWHLTSKPLK
jgi:hypothetical protein